MSNAAYALLQDQECKSLAVMGDFIKLQGSQDMFTAVNTLKQHKILSAPVFDGSNVIGMIDMLDLATFVASVVPPGVSYDAHAIEQLARNIHLRPIRDVINHSNRDTLAPVDSTAPVSMAAELFASGLHRVPVVNSQEEVVGLLTQFDVMKFLSENFPKGNLKAMGEMTIESFGLGRNGVASCNKADTVLEALRTLKDWQVSALAVVDNSNKIVGNLSVTDFEHLWSESTPHLLVTVGEFLEKYSPKSLNVKCTNLDATFSNVLKEMLDSHIHRMWVVDPSEHPIGVVSTTDIFKVVRDYSAPIESSNNSSNSSSNSGATKGAPHNGVTLRTAGNRFVAVKSNKLVVSDVPSVFEVESVTKGLVAFRASNGHYISVNDQHNVHLQNTRNNNCHFKRFDSERSGMSAFGDVHDGFLVVEGHGLVSKKGQNKTPTESQYQFRVTK